MTISAEQKNINILSRFESGRSSAKTSSHRMTIKGKKMTMVSMVGLNQDEAIKYCKERFCTEEVYASG